MPRRGKKQNPNPRESGVAASQAHISGKAYKPPPRKFYFPTTTKQKNSSGKVPSWNSVQVPVSSVNLHETSAWMRPNLFHVSERHTETLSNFNQPPAICLRERGQLTR